MFCVCKMGKKWINLQTLIFNGIYRTSTLTTHMNCRGSEKRNWLHASQAKLGRRKKARGRAQVYFFPGSDHCDHNFQTLSKIYSAVLHSKSVASRSVIWRVKRGCVHRRRKVHECILVILYSVAFLTEILSLRLPSTWFCTNQPFLL